MDGRLRFRAVISTGVVVASIAAVMTAPFAQAAPPSKTYIYWDQNQKLDFAVKPDGSHGRLLNSGSHGQMCIAHSGYFTVGYNETQRAADGVPATEPSVGIAAYDPHGHFVKSLYVPGPYKSAGQTVGSDLPNSHAGSYAGCAFDKNGNLFATDIGTAHGQVPTPDDGRLVEWFAADGYSSYCVVYGPTTGGFGPHHVDGTGGFRQPGLITFDGFDRLYVPEAGNQEGPAPTFGRVLMFAGSSLPQKAADCPGGTYQRVKLVSKTFLQGTPARQPFPIAVAPDVTCGCIVISSEGGEPAVEWYDLSGRPYTKKGPVVNGSKGDGTTFSPYGIAVDLQGNLFFADDNAKCRPTSQTSVDCTPTPGAGAIYEVTFKHGLANTPTAIAAGLTAPTGVTICVTGRMQCPVPGPRYVTNAEKRAAAAAAHRAAVQKARSEQRQRKEAAIRRAQMSHREQVLAFRRTHKRAASLARTGSTPALPTTALLAMLLGGAAFGLRRWSGSTAS